MRSYLFGLSVIIIAVILSLSACEGDQGPIGPIGPQGPEGPMGELGTQNCFNCHGNSQLITAKLLQYQHSVHYTGGHFYNNGTSCAVCHTSQGFLERAASGSATVAAPIQDPLPPNCYTCHQIHRTYTEADWAFTQPNPVTLWVGGQTVDLGVGNLCISCHQARVATPALPNAATGGTVNITNARYGPHHGPQGLMLPGLNGYELPGSMPYENSAHTTLLANNTANACIVCHMGPARGVDYGGHTFRVTGADGTLNTAACSSCHTNANELRTLRDQTQAHIEDLMEELRQLLIARGKLDPNTDLLVPGMFEGHEAGAFYNYRYVQEDQSRGVHNFKYARALLMNSIEAMQ